MKYPCTLLFFILLALTATGQVRTSVQTGDWTDPNTWDCSCVPAAGENAVIAAGHTVKLVTGGGGTFITNITIDGGGVLNSDNKNFTISGNAIINGTYGSTAGVKDLIILGGGTSLSGTGVINVQGKKIKFQGDVSILASTNLTVIGQAELDNGVTVTNNGAISFDDDIKGRNAASTWINAANSVLKAGKEIMDTGVLIANASGNRVEYFRKGNVDIKTPTPATYHHLTISGTQIKKMKTNLTIAGDLNIIATLDCDDYSINIRGNWITSGIFLEENGVVTFDGSSAQNVSGLFGETFYNLVISRTSGSCDMTLDCDITASNTLNMNSGNINTGSNKVILGTSTANEGTLVHTDGIIIGEFERWINSGSTGVGYLFPVGNCTFYRPATPTFNSILGLGGTVIGEFVEANPTNNGLSLEDLPDSLHNTYSEGYWSLEVANGFSSNDYDLDLTGNGFTSFTIDPSTRILSRPDVVTNWTAEGTHVAATSPTAHRAGIAMLSAHFSLADTTNCTAPSTSSIAGNTDVCTSDMGVAYSVTNTPGSTYTWTITGGTQVSGGTTNSITVDWGATGMVGTVQVVEDNGCTVGYPVTLSVNVNSIAPSGINGKTSVGQFVTGEVYAIPNPIAGYTYTWSVIGGAITSGQGTSSITIDWGASGSGQVCATGDNGTCGASPSVCINVNIYVVVESALSGDWDVPTTWDCNCVPQSTDNVRILNTHTVTLTGDETINRISINAGGTVDADANNKKLTVTGDFTVNGDYLGGGKELILSGVGTSIDGSGTITMTGNDIDIKSGSKNILSSAVLTVAAGSFDLKDAGIVITNNGTISIAEDLIAKDNTNTWNNASNSTLNIGGELFEGGVGNDGVLVASSAGNTVNYYGTVDQEIKDPISSVYHSLSASGTGIKEIFAPLDINGNVLIDGSAQLESGNFDFTLGGNWTNASINADPFLEQTTTITIDGTTDQIFTNASNETFYNLVVNKSSGKVELAAATGIQIDNALTLTNGTVDARTNGGMVIIPASASSTPGSAFSYVVGKVQKLGTTAFVFPVGDGGKWARIEMGAPAVGSTFEAEYFSAAYSDILNVGTLNNVSSQEHWILNRTAGTDIVPVKLYWEDGGFSGIDDLTDLVVARYDGVNWVDETQMGGTTGNTSVGTVTSQIITGFSPFTFGSSSAILNPLPIELVSFDAYLNEDRVDIRWETASQLHNDYFTIERSADGENWEEIIVVDGAGNSSQIIEYFEIDYEPLANISYYRLKQTDYFGQFTYSNIVPVKNVVDKKSEGNIILFPNPINVGGVVQVEFTGIIESEMLVVLRDIRGREYYSKVVVNIEDGKLIGIPIDSNIPKGIYLITASSKDQIYGQKLIVK